MHLGLNTGHNGCDLNTLIFVHVSVNLDGWFQVSDEFWRSWWEHCVKFCRVVAGLVDSV